MKEEATRFAMSETTLYRITLHRTFTLLKEGVWNDSDPNPFKFLPSCVVGDLLITGLSHYYTNIDDIKLLLTSGKVERLDLSFFDLANDRDLFMTLLSENNCTNLKHLVLHSFLKREHFPLVKAVLRNTPKLRHFHSAVFFGLDIFNHCEKLLTLKFDLPIEQISNYFLHKNMDFSKSLKNLKVFSLGRTGDCFSVCRIIETVLLNCPELVSVGMVDSSLAIAGIQKKRKEPLRFQLRRCFWGVAYMRRFRERTVLKLFNYRSEFSAIIKTAVSSCPLVEELIIDVHDENCLQYLSQLPMLTFLVINFKHYYCSKLRDPLISLFSQIGPQIKHLSIQKVKNIPINDICEYCPNLLSLQIIGTITVSEPSAISSNLRNLKRLYVSTADQVSFRFLLSNCLHLEELFLGTALTVDDELLKYVLTKNSLSELKTIGISRSKLNKWSLRRLLKSAVSLSKIGVSDFYYLVEELKIEMNCTQLNCMYIDAIKRYDFFSCRLDPYDF
ncbi:uncharacterized protein LOC129961117 isoform X1 [Argiope bruennichi]|uniref:uncharacterized protein LOC129961117 isoform X1 n=2 Tax=Argiope bruennichi TaxID=94029 RepID=UPI0024956C18|nr:uncharacterized protein LOC129961117 isoform X1 [Argiope bruennichi]